MLEFASPWVLALAPIAPVVVWLQNRRPRAAIVWPGADELTGISDRWSNWVSSMMWIAAMLAGVLALSGPRMAHAGEHLDTEGIAILLIVDVSGSMAEADFDWNGEMTTRLNAIKLQFQDFIKRRTNDRLGLVVFAALPDTACPLTLDRSAVWQSLNAVEPRGIPTESETNIGDALAWGVTRLKSEPGRKSIVLCSDGEHNVPAPALTPRQAAQLAAAAGLTVDTVFAGPSQGSGRDGLQTIARMTGGAAMEAHDALALDQFCDALDQLERQRNVDPRRLKYREAYPWLALAAAILMVVALAYTRGPGRVLP